MYPPAISPAKVLRRFQHRVAGLDAMADQLRANADASEETEVEETLDRFSPSRMSCGRCSRSEALALGVRRSRLAHARVEDPAVRADAGCIAGLGDAHEGPSAVSKGVCLRVASITGLAAKPLASLHF